MIRVCSGELGERTDTPSMIQVRRHIRYRHYNYGGRSVMVSGGGVGFCLRINEPHAPCFQPFDNKARFSFYCNSF